MGGKCTGDMGAAKCRTLLGYRLKPFCPPYLPLNVTPNVYLVPAPAPDSFGR